MTAVGDILMAIIGYVFLMIGVLITQTVWTTIGVNATGLLALIPTIVNFGFIALGLALAVPSTVRLARLVAENFRGGRVI